MGFRQQLKDLESKWIYEMEISKSVEKRILILNEILSFLKEF
jgi:hypothetical protein